MGAFPLCSDVMFPWRVSKATWPRNDFRRHATAGEFEGDGVVLLRGSAERSETPRGSLTPPWKCPAYADDIGETGAAGQ
jgi:hypothetical protein